MSVAGTTFCPLVPLQVWSPCCPQGPNKRLIALGGEDWGTNKWEDYGIWGKKGRGGNVWKEVCYLLGGRLSFHLFKFHEIHDWLRPFLSGLLLFLFCTNKRLFTHVFCHILIEGIGEDDVTKCQFNTFLRLLIHIFSSN